MPKKLISLTDREVSWIKEKSEEYGINESELIRRILDAHIHSDTHKNGEGWCIVHRTVCMDGEAYQIELLCVQDPELDTCVQENGRQYRQAYIAGPFDTYEECINELNRLYAFDGIMAGRQCECGEE